MTEEFVAKIRLDSFLVLEEVLTEEVESSNVDIPEWRKCTAAKLVHSFSSFLVFFVFLPRVLEASEE